jgi:glutathione S-transferase
MSEFTLVIGNRNYSSWSLRAGLAIRRCGADYSELVIPLDQPESARAIRVHSAAGMVPVLRHGGLSIWDSLAISEYLAERYPDAGLWPADADQRALARAVTSEMHSGYQALRSQLPMDLRARHMGRDITAPVHRDIARIIEIWTDCRRRAGVDGPFLFGTFTIADAFYAPVIGRFRTYGIELSGEAAAYADAVWNWPDMQDWLDLANDEPWKIDLDGA